LIDQPPADNGGDNFCRINLVRVYVEDILRKDDQVGEFSDFKRAFCLLMMAGKRCPKGVTIDRLRDC